MMRQMGGSNCGLFLIAVATSHCFEQDPSSVEYDQSQLKPHLTSCFLRKCMTIFPSKEKLIFSAVPVNRFDFRVYCICRQSRVSNVLCIRCAFCAEEYHPQCTSLEQPTTKLKTIQEFSCFKQRCKTFIFRKYFRDIL